MWYWRAARNENAVNIKLFLAACYVHINRKDDAAWIIDQLAVKHPTTRISQLKKSFPITDKKTMDKFLNDLHTAGMAD